MIFIGINGDVLEIASAVCVEHVILNELLEIPIANGVHRDLTLRKLARLASALAECNSGLRAEQWELRDWHARQSVGPFYPQPTPKTSSETFLKATFRGRLGDQNNILPSTWCPSLSEMRRPLVADVDIDGEHRPVGVVVKFTERYNVDAHRALADLDPPLAPKLHACQRVLGNMFMVVMERLEGQPMAYMMGEQVEPSVFADVEAAVSQLSSKGFVHGNLRAANIMIDPSKKHAKLIDFDWASKHEEGRYPQSINMELAGEWHPGVAADIIMLTEHDKYALEEVLKKRFSEESCNTREDETV